MIPPKALRTGVDAECRVEHQLEDRNDLVGIDDGHGDGCNDVDDGHERNRQRGEVRDALDSADDDEAQDDDERDGSSPGGNAPGVLDGAGDRIGLDARQHEGHGDDGHGREDHAVDLEQPAGLGVAVGLLDVEGRAAAVLTGAGILFLEDLAERRLDVRGRGAEECRDPHPDDGTGAAEADGGGDTGDIADADAARQRDRQGLEGRDSLIGALAREHLLEDGGDLTDLYRAGADREIDTRAEAQVDEGGRPHDPVEPVDESGHASPFVLPCRDRRHGVAYLASVPERRSAIERPDSREFS